MEGPGPYFYIPEDIVVQFNDASKAFWRYLVGTRVGVQEINTDDELRDLTELTGISGDIVWPGSAANISPKTGKNALTGWYHVTGYGASPDGLAASTTKNTTAIQNAINDCSVNGGGIVYFDDGNYYTNALLLASKVALRGNNAGGQAPAQTRLTYNGVAGGTVISPANRAANTINWGLKGIGVYGNGLAAIGVEMYQVGYSRIEDILVAGTTSVGVMLDSNVNGACYFNVLDGIKVDTCPVGMRIQRGANANRISGGAILNCGTSMEFLSLSAGNAIYAVDMEHASVKHVYVDAPANCFIDLHMEDAPIGYDITVNGGSTRRVNTTFASTVLTYVANVTNINASLDEISADTFALDIGALQVTTKFLSGSTTSAVEMKTNSGTATAILSFFRNLSTTGLKQFTIYRGNGSADTALHLDITKRNLLLGNNQTTGMGDVQGGFGISNASVVPTTNPVSGGVLYVEAGSLKYRGTSGTVTILGPA